MEITFNSGVVAKVSIPENTSLVVPATNNAMISIDTHAFVWAGEYIRSRFNGDPLYSNTAVWSMVVMVQDVQVIVAVSPLEAVALELEFSKINLG
jgi:hypothetical protein